MSIVGVGEGPSPALWRQLEIALRRRLAELEVAPSSYGLGMVLTAAAMFMAMGYQWVSSPQAITRSLLDMLGVS